MYVNRWILVCWGVPISQILICWGLFAVFCFYVMGNTARAACILTKAAYAPTACNDIFWHPVLNTSYEQHTLDLMIHGSGAVLSLHALWV